MRTKGLLSERVGVELAEKIMKEKREIQLDIIKNEGGIKLKKGVVELLEYIKEKTPGKNCNFFKIMDKCYEPSMEGDKHLFNEMEIYDNVEIYETEKNPEKNQDTIIEENPKETPNNKLLN